MSAESIIGSLGYRELQKQCTRVGLSAGGNANQLRKRLLENLDESPAPSAKRQKTTAQSMVDEFLCPISLALPFDPVTAGDGRVYEREAIQAHIKKVKKRKKPLKSPMTNKRMRPRLLPSPQIKNAIEKAVDSGEIEGELADSWIAREKANSEWMRKWNNGKQKQMLEMAHRPLESQMSMLTGKMEYRKTPKKQRNGGS